MKGKDVSKWAIVFASVWIIAHSVLRALWPLVGTGEYGLTMAEIVSSGVTLVIVWTPVYRSIWLDKKTGRQQEQEG